MNGEALRYARKVKLNMTQEEFAATVGTDVSMIYKAETEKPIDAPFAHAIARAAGELLPCLMKYRPEVIAPTAADIQLERVRLIVELDLPKELAAILKQQHFAENLFALFQAAAWLRNGAAKVALQPGSILVSADVTRSDAQHIFGALLEGKLKELHVVSINVASDTLLADKAELGVLPSAEAAPKRDESMPQATTERLDDGTVKVIITLPIEFKHFDLEDRSSRFLMELAEMIFARERHVDRL